MNNYIPKEQRKKILLIGDDLRQNSGVATVLREIVIGTAHRYNWIQIASAMTHPEQGKRIDLSEDTNKITGLTDSSVLLVPFSGYGNSDLIRQIVDIEKPDALMFMTDPRYYIWLFQIENEIRRKVPFIYLNIWDDLPTPLYNFDYYTSCDALMAISKQTLNINKLVLDWGGTKWVDIDKEWVTDDPIDKFPIVLKYIPHGINPKFYFPIDKDHVDYSKLQEFKKKIIGDKEYDFIILWNSRNIRRKNPGDVILSYKEFLNKLPKDKASKCLLIMHTQPIDENGTDLFAVKEAVCGPEDNIIFSASQIDVNHMNYLYNIADVTLLISSNEGWGLSTTEGLMTGTMMIGNVTGGIQDQMRFEDENGNWINFNKDFCSNHFGTYKKCGEWAIPVFPSNMSLLGSVPTPYIFDDRCDFRDVAKAIEQVYNMSSEERINRGISGRNWVLSNESMMSSEKMCENVINITDRLLLRWIPRKPYTIEKIKSMKPKKLEHKLVY